MTGVTSAWGQVDSVSINNDSTSQVTTPVAPGHATPQLRHDEPFSKENSTILKAEEVPPSLSGTLNDPAYEGWREGIVRRHMQTGEYEVEIVQGTEKKTYRFNQVGERIPEE
jgi:hypothetical protein